MSEIMSRNGNVFNVVDADSKISIEYFDGITLDKERMSRVTFEHCVFLNCMFDHCDLRHVRFDNCTFVHCYFTHSKFEAVSFVESSIVSCNFSGVLYSYNLYNHFGFSMCSVSSTVFENSDLLNKCDIGRSHFDNCILPDNFDKRRFGEILEEDIIGWKKCVDDNDMVCIVKLLIPKGSIVYSINGKKCRTNKCKVLDIVSCADLSENTHLNRASSAFYARKAGKFTYYVGDEFNIKNFDMDYAKECATGIHFFRDKTTAWNY